MADNDKLPIDFEQQVRLAAAPNGKGPPVQISSRDLMANFRHCNVGVDGTEVGGLSLRLQRDFAGQPLISLEGDVQSTGLPSASEGEIVRYVGGEWVTVETEWLEVYICIGGTPTLRKILAEVVPPPPPPEEEEE
jgi:hypothetical protein